ncbi:MAG: lipocalin family protein [Vampirovibrionales bacterium]|nr:lipocalin family protein [Vampirovibrionales bacterium]
MNATSRNLLIGGLVLGATWLSANTLAASAKPKLPPLQPVPQVDLKKYAGDWYEIAFVPYFFEKKDQREALTRYTPVDAYTYEDYFQAKKPDGSLKTYTGRLRSKAANRPGTTPNGEFRSTFVKLFNWQYWLGVDYLVTGLGKNYDYLVVSGPSRKLNWVFSRSPKLSIAQLREISQILNYQHIDACKMLTIPQTGGLQTQQPFCNVLKQAETTLSSAS